ncbi:hypothetical protein Pla52nx_004075 [Stieleria varia]|uniref:Uncharacterized protein n=1 Tax=Stieleria varia TaxID=2528005 RepID=A0A5C6AU97_9BACT|nr:hypothetical protein [Stieleria varia]TWU02626.1 hypothetical protein Pla52n_36820 [Stieleria varia]
MIDSDGRQMILRTLLHIGRFRPRDNRVAGGQVGGVIQGVPQHADTSDFNPAENQHYQDNKNECELNGGGTLATRVIATVQRVVCIAMTG